MLKNIPSIISPELLKVLMEMGHGDEIVIADGNFPGAAMAKRLIRLDGHGVPEVLDAVLKLMPLDSYTKQPAGLMKLMDCDVGKINPVIWDKYAEIVAKYEPAAAAEGFEAIDRFEFYERAKNVYAVVMTGETAVYANIILKKGVVTE